MNKDIKIIGLKRVPTREDIDLVGLVGRHESDREAWDFCAAILADVTGLENAVLIPVSNNEPFEKVGFEGDDGWWYLPAEIFIWEEA